MAINGLPDLPGDASGPEPSKANDESAFFSDMARADRMQELETERRLKEGRKKRKGRNILFMIVPIALVGGLVAWQPWSGDDDTILPVDGVTERQRADAMPVQTKEFWQDPETGKAKYPSEKKDWELTVPDNKDFDHAKLLREKYSSTEMASASGVLPSRQAGFTSDKDKVKLADGTLNPMYTLATSEDYQETVFGYVERFVNPMYGDWSDYTEVGGVDRGRWANMYTQSALEKYKNVDERKFLPIFADWDNNKYGLGDKLLGAGAPKWMGEVTSSKTTFTWDDKTMNYKSKLIAEVQYKAWAKDQSVITKNGTITLDLVTNTALDGYKFLIDSSNLTMK